MFVWQNEPLFDLTPLTLHLSGRLGTYCNCVLFSKRSKLVHHSTALPSLPFIHPSLPVILFLTILTCDPRSARLPIESNLIYFYEALSFTPIQRHGARCLFLARLPLPPRHSRSRLPTLPSNPTLAETGTPSRTITPINFESSTPLFLLLLSYTQSSTSDIVHRFFRQSDIKLTLCPPSINEPSQLAFPPSCFPTQPRLHDSFTVTGQSLVFDYTRPLVPVICPRHNRFDPGQLVCERYPTRESQFPTIRDGKA